MLLIDILDAQMPGDQALGVPCFSKVAEQALLREHGTLAARMSEFLEDFASETDLSESFFNFLKRRDIELYSEFREVVVSLYFTAKPVLAALGEEQIPLFPRGQSLPEINYDLLESVYQRGSIWRPLNKE